MCRKTVVKQELEFFDFDTSSVEYPVTKQSRNFTSLFISQCICRDAVIEVIDYTNDDGIKNIDYYYCQGQKQLTTNDNDIQEGHNNDDYDTQDHSIQLL